MEMNFSYKKEVKTEVETDSLILKLNNVDIAYLLKILRAGANHVNDVNVSNWADNLFNDLIKQEIEQRRLVL